MQGSADAFGRLSKVRSELETLLWTHPSGSQSGIADALEYLNKVTRSQISFPVFLLYAQQRSTSMLQCMCGPDSKSIRCVIKHAAVNAAAA